MPGLEDDVITLAPAQAAPYTIFRRDLALRLQEHPTQLWKALRKMLQRLALRCDRVAIKRFQAHSDGCLGECLVSF
jgi:hypothetical protein